MLSVVHREMLSTRCLVQTKEIGAVAVCRSADENSDVVYLEKQKQ